MNVPLCWLSEYVTLPKEVKRLTDKLTMVGHMLDKIHDKEGETVIDLELRGNRADMFGLIGVARDISSVLGTNLKLPPVSDLPKVDPKCPLVKVEKGAVDLVPRYTALHLGVTLGPSPKWLVKHLELYGIPSINNVVDVTNYVMVETGIPLHAFDYHQVEGGQLIIRKAKKDEQFQTIQQGLAVTLTPDDLVIADSHGPLTLTMIGGLSSKVIDSTTEIILEAAVYHPASCRRSSRRLKIFTESGSRLEKHLDPNQVTLALQRAVYLLKQTASARALSLTSDHYPHPVKPKTIKFDESEIIRLTGLEVTNWSKILLSLGFEIKGDQITVPTFRTDIEGTADIVEEVVRIYGYDHIPETPITASTPVPNTYPSYAISEKLRDTLVQLGLSEAITLTMVDDGEVALVNPPDPDLKWLRNKIYPSLVNYANRLLNLRQSRVAVFEIGKVFHKTSKGYSENLSLGIVLAGKNLSKAWNTNPRDLSQYDLVGILDRIKSLLGVNQLQVTTGMTNNIYWAEIDMDKLVKDLPTFANPYAITSAFPPVIEDVNIKLVGSYKALVTKIKQLSFLVKQIELIDKYDDKLTLRITYHSDSKQLSSADISPIRDKIEAISQRV